MSGGGLNVNLAYVVVSIISVSGFVARERAVFLVLDARPVLGQVKVEISSLEDVVLNGSS